MLFPLARLPNRAYTCLLPTLLVYDLETLVMTNKTSQQTENRTGSRVMKWMRAQQVRLRNRLRVSVEFSLVLMAVIVGVGTGIGAVAFRYLIRAVEWAGYQWFPSITASLGKAYVIIVPAVGGLLVGLLIFHFAREAKGHGVPEVMEAVALQGGRIRPVVAIVKAFASSLSIGSGGSVGREGPIVQIGSALGSSIGQILRLPSDRIRNLVACGAAGGIAATFNAPIAGVFFALEVILGEFSVSNFSTVVVAAVTSSVIGQAVFGDLPAFAVPMEYQVNSVWEFGFYPLLGAFAALLGIAFTKLLYWSEDVFARLKSIPEWIQPAIGGAVLGMLALGYPLVTGVTWERIPQVFNVGYDVIDAALQNQLTIKFVLVLMVLKLLATSLTLGSGGSGGVFAPSLFMGAMLGYAFGGVVQLVAPFTPAQPGAYALVGMGAVFSAAAHAPISAVLILFELTGDYRIILPLMLTIVVATLISRRVLKGESVYTLKLSRRGIRLRGGRDIDLMASVQVSEVMTTEVDTVGHDLTIVGFSEVLGTRKRRRFPFLDSSGRLLGMVTANDLERALQANVSRGTTVQEIGKSGSELVLAYPDESIGEVMVKMSASGLGRLPVVSRIDPGILVGMIAREDILRAYQVALARRSELSHRVRRAEMHVTEGTEFVEVQISDGDPSAGKAIQEIASSLPNDCILVSINRGGKTIIPHGDDILAAGDILTVFATVSAVKPMMGCLKATDISQKVQTQRN